MTDKKDGPNKNANNVDKQKEALSSLNLTNNYFLAGENGHVPNFCVAHWRGHQNDTRAS